MRYFVNILTGALAADYIRPAYPAYWKEISESEYKKLLAES